MLNSAQFGFRAKISNELACQSAIRDIYANSLNKTILLKKLYNFSTKSKELLWFKSYFASRNQHVIYNNFSFILLPVDNGVSQGNMAAPIIFIVFINDIVRS